MLRILLLLFVLVASTAVHAQLTIEGIVKNDEGDALPRATVRAVHIPEGKSFGALADANGVFKITGVPNGRMALRVSYIGFAPFIDTINVPRRDTAPMQIVLHENAEEEAIVVSATRVARALADVPMRVELIPAEDLDESIIMDISSSKMVLSELPGIHGQVTSAGLGSAVMRIRGLDGRYTQILQDGIPSFGGLNTSFSVLELPPLNLKQLEVVKGSSAGLHSDAIGGIINFITYEPLHDTPDATLIANGTSFGGKDLTGLYGQRFGSVGLSVHGLYTDGPRRDLDNDGFADVAAHRQFSISPKLSWTIDDHSRAMVEGSLVNDRRLGGMLSAPEDYSDYHPGIYATATVNQRTTMSGSIQHMLPDSSTIVIDLGAAGTTRQSFDGASQFNGDGRSLYADGQWSASAGRWQFLVGVSGFADRFLEGVRDSSVSVPRDYDFAQTALFTQEEYRFSQFMTGQASLRIDNHNRYGLIATPRFALMVKPSDALTLRLSAGTGWHAPTIFDEDAEARGFRGVPPLNVTRPELARSASVNMLYRADVSGWQLNVDLSGYAVRVKDRTDLAGPDSLGRMSWFTGETLTSTGIELITQIHRGAFSAVLGYTLTYATIDSADVRWDKTFTPWHVANLTAQWHVPDVIRANIEMLAMASQYLPDNPHGFIAPGYVTFGVSAEVWLSHIISVFANVEDIADVRQTRVTPLYIGTPGQPNFNPNFVWGQVEGRVFNVGVKVVL